MNCGNFLFYRIILVAFVVNFQIPKKSEIPSIQYGLNNISHDNKKTVRYRNNLDIMTFTSPFHLWSPFMGCWNAY